MTDTVNPVWMIEFNWFLLLYAIDWLDIQPISADYQNGIAYPRQSSILITFSCVFYVE